MSDFNFQKAWFAYPKQAIENFNFNQLNAISKIVPLIGELNQGKDLNIPMTQAIEENLNILSTKELAELSRAIYFYGHWRPGTENLIFNNSRGESWKIANCADQILRKRLGDLGRCLIHDGILRITYSSKDCWIWEEFGLATIENLEKLHEAKKTMTFCENTLIQNALKLAREIGDLWDLENIPDTPGYSDFLEAEKIRLIEKNKKDKLRKLEQLKAKIKEAETEYNAFDWLINHNIDTDNVIYYGHENTFCFGWRNTLTEDQISALKPLLSGFPYPAKFK